MLDDRRSLNDSLWHTLVEVIDLETRSVLVRHRFPFHAQLAGPGVVAHPYLNDKGETEVETWRMTLKQ